MKTSCHIQVPHCIASGHNVIGFGGGEGGIRLCFQSSSWLGYHGHFDGRIVRWVVNLTHQRNEGTHWRTCAVPISVQQPHPSNESSVWYRGTDVGIMLSCCLFICLVNKNWQDSTSPPKPPSASTLRGLGLCFLFYLSSTTCFCIIGVI